MMTDYGVRVIRAYENKRVGQIIFPAGVLRQRLVQQHWAEPTPVPGSDQWGALSEQDRADVTVRLEAHGIPVRTPSKFGKRLTLKG